MHIFKRGSVYWFECVFAGQRHQRSTRVKNQRDAKAIAATFYSSLAKGEVGITERKPSLPFARAMARFLDWSLEEHRAHPKTAERYRYSSAALLRYFREIPLNRISAESVESFKLNRAGETGSHTERRLRPATVNRELACLKAVFNHAIKGDANLRNPVSRVKFLAEQNDQNRVVTYVEQETYLQKATPNLKDVAILVVETGMRPEEVFNLKRDDVNLSEGFLTVHRGKTPAARRRIALTKAAAAMLKGRLGASVGSPYVYPHSDDPARPLPNVHGAHHRALRKSKVAPFRLYDLRHTWATRAAECGIDPVTLAAMLGHSRIQMVLRYAHPTQIHQTSAMERVETHNASQAKKERETATKEARSKSRMAS
jgi:integrase